ncbi:MAG: hypothetical protein J7M32_02345 [Deltaproteobacteria bacterium]|nr:hypothetical protein [Deltaproteobacteria bacterium]OQX65681.1 MAG: hypothetical protein B5M55_03460 [Desulfococcus sp. 4484_242]
MKICAEISPGELFDKIAILEIKKARIRDLEKLRHIETELDLLKEARSRQIPASAALGSLYREIKEVNERLWEIEDAIRRCERNKEFGEDFVRLARSVYLTNDRRSRIKKEINERLGARIVEEKSYEPY